MAGLKLAMLAMTLIPADNTARNQQDACSAYTPVQTWVWALVSGLHTGRLVGLAALRHAQWLASLALHCSHPEKILPVDQGVCAHSVNNICLCTYSYVHTWVRVLLKRANLLRAKGKTLRRQPFLTQVHHAAHAHSPGHISSSQLGSHS